MYQSGLPVYRLIDSFCGAGGITRGFTLCEKARFLPVWANDFNQYAVNTYNANFGSHCIVGDIVDILRDPSVEIPKADVVIGGPPCQGFSLLNKNRDEDPRKQLWRPFLEIVRRSEAKVFVMENVPQLLGSFEHGEIQGVAQEMGFFVTAAKLCAADYGVPQTRWRAFIIGCTFTSPSCLFPPKRTHYDPREKRRPFKDQYERPLDLFDRVEEREALYVTNACPWTTVRDAISDLPPPVGTEIRTEQPPLDLHFGRTPTATSLKRYMAIPREGMNRFDLQRAAPHLTPACWIRKKSGGTDLFGRLWWDRPAFTIRTEFFKPEKGRYLHPEQHRPISHREAARFQSFPDDFLFTGSKIEVAKQIGNAVPPRLGLAVANVVAELLDSYNANGGRILLAEEKRHYGARAGLQHAPGSQD
jgi:DNA (cytosine-5)-methyltransferase 1